jgi:cysteine desulfurase
MTIYLDYQASTPIDPRAKAVMIEALEKDFANPSSESHSEGWQARKRVEQSRQKIAKAIGCEADEIIFTSGATEADNLGVLGAALAAPAGRRRILVGSTEHKAVLEPAIAAKRFGYTVELIPVDHNGLINFRELEARLNDDVAVVSIMLVNNEIGTIQPIELIAPLVARSGAFFHTDATQAPTAVPLDMLELGVDAASFSSHKIYGPKGVGAFFLSASAPWQPKPLMFGGGQEGGLRPGTIPTHLCAGFAAAFALIADEGGVERADLKVIRDQFARTLLQQIPGCRLTTDMSHHHPGNLHLSFQGVDAGDLLDRLQPRVAAARGSACTSGEEDFSHVLKAIGKSRQEGHECIRFSLGRFTLSDEVDETILLIQNAVNHIRNGHVTP